jgi:hypothetical protein
MNDLDPRARAIVDAARNADTPSSTDRNRIKRAILLQVAATSALASTAMAGTLSIGTKVGLAVLAVTLVGGGTFGVVKLREAHKPVAAKAHVAAKIVVAQKPTALSVEAPEIAVQGATPSEPSDGRPRKAEKPRKVAAGSGLREDEQTTAEDRINAEVDVLKRAREELRLGRPTSALEALREYDRRFGEGVLGEERQAIAAIAACQAQPGPSARAQAQAFMRKAPHSPLLDRVRAACITPKRSTSE